MKNLITAVMAALVLAGAAATAQPVSKAAATDQTSTLEMLEKVALARVPGEVLERRAQKYPTGMNYEYLIAATDGRKVVVTVDGKTRKVFAIMEEPVEIPTGMTTQEE